MSILAIDHVQLAMPPGAEAEARAFYGSVLGLPELPKPPVLAARGGVWFGSDAVQLHLGVETDFRPARKAHPALRVDDLDGLAAACRASGFTPEFDTALPGTRRFYVADPFGNRLEFLQPEVSSAPAAGRIRRSESGLEEAMGFRIAEEPEGGGDVPPEVRRGIREADPADVGARDWLPLCLSLRTVDGTLAGGVYGATMWRWLVIDGLWVAEGLRGGGLGSRLLAAAEAAAISRGCRGVWLGTFDFQARGFYERHGYRVFGTLPDFPAGHSHYELYKVLDEPS